MRNSKNSDNDEQHAEEAVEQLQNFEKEVCPNGDPLPPLKVEDINLETMSVKDNGKAQPVYGDIEIEDDHCPSADDVEKESRDDENEQIDDFGDFEDAFNTLDKCHDIAPVAADDFGGFGETTSLDQNNFDASFGYFQAQENDQDDDDFGDFGDMTSENRDDDFGGFGGEDDFRSFPEPTHAPLLQPVSLGPVWEELKAATDYEIGHIERIPLAWEKHQNIIDQFYDVLNAKALELTWSTSATKTMLETIMPKFHQLTLDVEREREEELQKQREEKEEKKILSKKKELSQAGKDLLSQLPDISYLNA